MKTVARILIILAVAVTIAGVALLVVNVSGAQASQSFGERQFSPRQELSSDSSSSGLGQAGSAPGQFGSDSGRGGFGDSRGGEGGAFSLAEVFKNIAIVAVIVVIVTAVERLLKAIRRKRLAQVPVSASQPGRKE